MGRTRNYGLTAREWEVLELLRRDYTNEQIAERLGISLAGAKYHVSEIISKLGVSSRDEAAGLPVRRLGFGRAITWGLGLAAVAVTVGVGVLAWGVLQSGSGDDDGVSAAESLTSSPGPTVTLPALPADWVGPTPLPPGVPTPVPSVGSSVDDWTPVYSGGLPLSEDDAIELAQELVDLQIDAGEVRFVSAERMTFGEMQERINDKWAVGSWEFALSEYSLEPLGERGPDAATQWIVEPGGDGGFTFNIATLPKSVMALPEAPVWYVMFNGWVYLGLHQDPPQEDMGHCRDIGVVIEANEARFLQQTFDLQPDSMCAETPPPCPYARCDD